MNAGTAIVLFLYPISFAYAVIKHRVLDIPVLLRRSVRYVLVQRGSFCFFSVRRCWRFFCLRTISPGCSRDIRNLAWA